MVKQGYMPVASTMTELIGYCERFKYAETVNESVQNGKGRKDKSDRNDGNRKRSLRNGRISDEIHDKRQRKFYCHLHGADKHHDTGQCKVLLAQAEKMRGTYEAKFDKTKAYGNKKRDEYCKKEQSGNNVYSKKEVHAMLKECYAAASAKRKTDAKDTEVDNIDMENFNYEKWSAAGDFDDEQYEAWKTIGSEGSLNNNESDIYYDSSQQLFTIRETLQPRPKKKQRTEEQLAPIVFGRLNTTKNGKPKPIDVKILLDGGASESIIMEKFTKKLKQKKCPKTVWKTQAGIFNTTHKVTTQFSLPELNEKCLIEYDMHVAPGQSAYDIIIGRDLLTELGIEMSFKEMTVTWDQRSINMKPHDCQVETHYHIDDSASINEATDRIKEILDAKYEKADLAQVARECAHLTTDEQTGLLKILKKYEILFDGTLGKWTGDPYTIETRKDFKPYHARAYPIPRIHEKTLKMEVERLVQAGVLKKSINQSVQLQPSSFQRKMERSDSYQILENLTNPLRENHILFQRFKI